MLGSSLVDYFKATLACSSEKSIVRLNPLISLKIKFIIKPRIRETGKTITAKVKGTRINADGLTIKVTIEGRVTDAGMLSIKEDDKLITIP